ncbi:MAG: YopX family protein [Ruminococcus sp.]|nr:YopX family protein [Ruminococcus sp.]MCM1380367.1 YopX family protein [Muribaculaceae bacterium]MCM1478323.1 YopX family protein [Muribaculaceae bacterium]
MQREILFRGKHYKKWLYGDLSDCTPVIYILENICGIPYEVNPETIGQFTGLLDKNGNKVFEGDIVHGNVFGDDWIGVIVWIDRIAGFGVRYSHRSEPTAWENSSMLRLLTSFPTDEFAAEIIGNIYDNPELLNEEAHI